MKDNQTMHPRITKGIEALFGRLESLTPDGAKVHFARLCEAIAQRMEGPDPYPFDGLADAACELDILTCQLAGPDANPPLLFGGRAVELPGETGAAWLVEAGITTSDQERHYAFPIAAFSLVGDPPRPRGIRVEPQDVDDHNRDQLTIAFRNWAAWASDLERVDLHPVTQDALSAAVAYLQNDREVDYIVRTFCGERSASGDSQLRAALNENAAAMTEVVAGFLQQNPRITTYKEALREFRKQGRKARTEDFHAAFKAVKPHKQDGQEK